MITSDSQFFKDFLMNILTPGSSINKVTRPSERVRSVSFVEKREKLVVKNLDVSVGN
jgi:hypothetical protein